MTTSKRQPHSPTRRTVLGGAGLATLLGMIGPAAFAQPPGDAKFILIVLRGGLDGLAALAPTGDRRYAELRGDLAFTPDQLLRVTDGFGLHPALPTVHGLYQQRQALFIPAAHPGYNTRSHFDAQDMLEAGVNQVHGADDGWLNRALQAATPREAVAIGPTIPLVLSGEAPATSWAPNVLPEADPDTLARLEDLYAYDPTLSSALEAGLRADTVASEMDGDGQRRRRRQFAETAQAAARFMTADGGAGVCVLSLGGWDTHFNQGLETGRLANALSQLDTGLAALQQGLGEAWDRTAIVIASEFGRTARVNGANGTDHGVGGLVMLAGGAVNGGQVAGDWPGLDQLYEDRDVRPANDLRAIVKGVLAEHWGLDRADLDTRVFPDSQSASAMTGLIA